MKKSIRMFPVIARKKVFKKTIFYNPLSTYPETGRFLSKLGEVHNFWSENDDHKMASNAKRSERTASVLGTETY